MTEPTRTYRVVAGNRVPLAMLPRIIAAIRARYPEATSGIANNEAAVRAALRAWLRETLTVHEEAEARAALPMVVAQTITEYDQRAAEAAAKAGSDAETIVDDVAPPQSSELP